MSVIAILQARMSSVRLPGKVLMPLFGMPMLLVMLDRVMASKRLDKVIVATSTDKTDDVIFDFCIKNGIGCFRGSLTDVLDRYYQAAMVFIPHHVVRLTADCPLINTEIMDKTIEKHLDGGFDFTANFGFPDGYDVEIMTLETLSRAWREASTPEEREHVTPYIRNNPDKFRIGRFENSQNMSHVKISVDTQEDYQRLKALVEILLPSSISIWLKTQ